ncbi:MAG: TlpA disulfide reductase family protein [Planctomycetota bacterium]|nr:TlpA disulfide reductase family protein [Planctomycetota bacterium]
MPRALLILAVLLFLTIPVRAQEAGEEDAPKLNNLPRTPAAQPGAASTPPAAPQANPARELFVRAARSIREAKSITYSARSYSTGSFLGSTSRAIRADARQVRAPGGILPGWRLRLTGQISAPGGKDPWTDFDVAWLVNGVEWVDHTARTVIEKSGIDARRARGVNAIAAVRLDDLTSPQPFARELAGSEFEPQPTQDLDGTRCEGVLVTFNDGRNRAVWYFSEDDHLPRRVERIITSKDTETGRVVLEWTNVRVDTADPAPTLLASLRVDVPEGYTEDRPPAPVPVPGANTPGGPTFERPAKSEPKDPVNPAPIDPAPADAAPPATPDPTPPPAPRLAPEFELRTPTGDTVSLASLRGSVVLLEFAGSWAVRLREAHAELGPVLERVQGRNVRAYTLAVREKSRDLAIAGHAPPSDALGLLLDADATARAFGAHVFPSYAIVDGAGVLVMPPTRYVPETTMAELSAALDAALGEPAPGADTPPPAP